MEILALSGCTALAWLFHLALASAYMRLFTSAKTAAFRITHSIEISILISVLLIVCNFHLSVFTTLATVLGTLAILDLILFNSSKSLRKKFDALHFVIAYSVITLVVILSNTL